MKHKKLLITAIIGCSALPLHSAIVFQDDFDSYTDTSFAGSPTSIALVADGGGGNAIVLSGNTGAGGFFAPGFSWVPEIQPGPDGPNTTINLADYTLSFDVTYSSAFAPSLEIWVADGPRFSTNNAILYGAGGFTTGVPQTVSFNLSQNIITQLPNGYTNPGGAFSPTTDTFFIQFNMISFGAPADTNASLTVDNFQLDVIPEPSAMILAMAGLGGLALRRRRN